MNKTFKFLLLLISIAITIFIIVVAINQTTQFVNLAKEINPHLGNAVLYFFLFLYPILVLIPVYLFIRLPKPLIPPKDNQSSDYTKFIFKFGNRLSKNKLVKHLDLDLTSRSGIQIALDHIEKQANNIIRETAGVVFLTTAISQSGRLDAITVLIAQSRMVWKIAHTYYQRPTLREFSYLYANVAATTFIAYGIDDIDINEQIEPVITNLLGGSLAGAIPGVAVGATIVTNSVLSGSANAFLTLRVGAITKKYCGALVFTDRKSIRRLASAEAAGMLGSIIVDSGGKFAKTVYKGVKNKLKLHKENEIKDEPYKNEKDESISVLGYIKKLFK